MGAAAETLKTLNKFRIGFMRLFRKLKIDGIFLDDPEITDDGYIISTVYPADKNGNRLSNSVVFKVKFKMDDNLYREVSFLPEGDESRPSKIFRGPYTMDKFSELVDKYKKERNITAPTTNVFNDEYDSSTENANVR